MRIDIFFDEFINSESLRYDTDLRKTAKALLKGSKPYSLTKMPEFGESEYLAENIKSSVKAAPRGKDSAIRAYKAFVSFLRQKGVEVEVTFPPIPIENSFERQMYIAKYLQDEKAKISELEDILWVSGRTIDQDLQRLYRGSADPIQVCGRPFFIPGGERANGQIRTPSTAHPLFLTENLTQIIVMLKGLRIMAENPIYTRYAEATAADIWQQLSDYAKKRIHFVLRELLPDDLSWYEKLEVSYEKFVTERDCSVNGNVLLDCFKNDKAFCVEYRGDDGDVTFYDDCHVIPGSHKYSGNGISVEVNCRQGVKTLESDRVVRSAYSVEELAAD